MSILLEQNIRPQEIYSRTVILEKKGYKTSDNIMNIFSDAFWYELYKEVPMGNLRITAEYLTENLFAPLLDTKKWNVLKNAYNAESFVPEVKIEIGEYVFTISSEISAIFDLTHVSFKSNQMAYQVLKTIMNEVWSSKEEKKSYVAVKI